MFRLYLFVRKHSYPLLFVFLQIVAFSLIFSSGIYHQVQFLNVFQEFTGSIYQSYRNTQQYFHLRNMNETLVTENARLKEMLYAMAETDMADSQFADTNKNIRYSFIPAKIVNNSFQSRNNFLTLNKGLKDSIYPRMGVITVNGVLGIVKSVSENYALVISILNSDFMVSAKIVETASIGSVTWDGHSPEIVIMKDIPSHVKLAKGQQVVIGPYSAIFPENTPIGTVRDFKISSTGEFYDINIALSCNMRDIYYAYVVHNPSLVEQLKIEEDIIK